MKGPSAKSRVVCVLGMHRSGTSLTARILNILGVHLGPEEGLGGRSSDNPAGFWEHLGLRRLNDQILCRLGGRWDQPPHFSPGWEDSLRSSEIGPAAREVLEELSGTDGIWGWKDPRNSLTFPFWAMLLPPMKTVVCLRNPRDVGLSLQQRNGFPIDKGAALWSLYTCSALRHTQTSDRLLVFYEDLLTSCFQDVERLAGFVGLRRELDKPGVRNRIQDHLDPSLHHHRSTLTDTMQDARIPAAVKAAYFGLRVCQDRLKEAPQRFDRSYEEAALALLEAPWPAADSRSALRDPSEAQNPDTL